MIPAVLIDFPNLKRGMVHFTPKKPSTSCIRTAFLKLLKKFGTTEQVLFKIRTGVFYQHELRVF